MLVELLLDHTMDSTEMFPNPCFEICKSHQITGHEISNQIKSQEQVAIQISNQFNSKWSITKSNLKYLTNIWQISSGKDYACSQALVPLILVRALLSYTKPIAISGVLPFRDVTIQLFRIHDSIQIQTKCLDSIQIQFFKMLIASKLNSRFNSTINFHLNSVHNSIQLSKLHFKSIHNSIPLNSGHWCLGILYYLYSWR